MNRFKKLHRYPRAILILLAAMTLVFTALYLAASARKGFLYQDALLLPKQTEDGVQQVMRDPTGEWHAVVSYTIRVSYGLKIK